VFKDDATCFRASCAFLEGVVFVTTTLGGPMEAWKWCPPWDTYQSMPKLV